MTIVLDNEAAQALADIHHTKHRAVLTYVYAATRRSHRRAVRAEVLVPTAVRVEASIDRNAPAMAAFGRLRVVDVPLDSVRANGAVRLRALAGGSAVDACVAELATSLEGNVTVLTADLTDVPALLSAASSGAVVHQI